MIYWNKDRKYRNVLYMNLLFMFYVIWGGIDTFAGEASLFAFMFCLFIIIAFNVERWLHYKAYSKTQPWSNIETIKG